MNQILHGLLYMLLGGTLLAVLLGGASIFYRKVEVQNSLQNALEQSLEAVMDKSVDTVSSNEALVEEFLQQLLYMIGSDGDIEVQVEGIDRKKGLLSVTVKETFPLFWGQKATATAASTAVLEQVQEKEYLEICYVTKKGEMMKRYHQSKGSKLYVPEGVWVEVALADDGSWLRAENGELQAKYNMDGTYRYPSELVAKDVCYMLLE